MQVQPLLARCTLHMDKVRNYGNSCCWMISQWRFYFVDADDKDGCGDEQESDFHCGQPADFWKWAVSEHSQINFTKTYGNKP